MLDVELLSLAKSLSALKTSAGLFMRDIIHELQRDDPKPLEEVWFLELARLCGHQGIILAKDIQERQMWFRRIGCFKSPKSLLHVM